MDFKDRVDVLSKFVGIIAIVLGGIWTYNIFVKERQHFPHANVQHKVAHVPLSSCVNLVRVGVEIANSGKSRLLSSKSVVWIQKIRPISVCPSDGQCVRADLQHALADPVHKQDRFTWPLIGYRENQTKNSLDLEPDEKEEQDYEFVVPSSVEFVRIYSYYQNDERSTGADTGWRTSTFHDLKTDPKERAKCKQQLPFG
jgi:hypothetical protein